ncbi:unnamed protein product [Calypogeia fissa]
MSKSLVLTKSWSSSGPLRLPRRDTVKVRFGRDSGTRYEYKGPAWEAQREPRPFSSQQSEVRLRELKPTSCPHAATQPHKLEKECEGHRAARERRRRSSSFTEHSRPKLGGRQAWGTGHRSITGGVGRHGQLGGCGGTSRLPNDVDYVELHSNLSKAQIQQRVQRKF